MDEIIECLFLVFQFLKTTCCSIKNLVFELLQRGSDELLQRDMLSNGTSTSLSPANLETAEAKKVKLDQAFCADSPQSSQSAVSSKVLHIRNVPSDASESDIAQLGIPFGRMSNLVLAKKKNQALLEMEDVTLAARMVHYYSEHPPQVKGRSLIIQFSNHKELKTEQPNVAAQNALQAANNLAVSAANDDSKSVLRVIVENVLYPITVHDLHKVSLLFLLSSHSRLFFSLFFYSSSLVQHLG